jgi:hypothetical protein
MDEAELIRQVEKDVLDQEYRRLALFRRRSPLAVGHLLKVYGDAIRDVNRGVDTKTFIRSRFKVNMIGYGLPRSPLPRVYGGVPSRFGAGCRRGVRWRREESEMSALAEDGRWCYPSSSGGFFPFYLSSVGSRNTAGRLGLTARPGAHWSIRLWEDARNTPFDAEGSLLPPKTPNWTLRLGQIAPPRSGCLIGQ